MATPQDTRNELLAEKIIKSFKKRHMNGYFCKTSEDAVKKVLELIDEGSSVTWGGGMTLRDAGISGALSAGNYNVIDRELCKSPEEIDECLRKAFHADWYISGINGLSEDGQIVNVDGLGNRVAAITYGPKKVLFVAGLNKVTQDLDSAVKRARSTAAPINNMRFDIQTPCHVDGVCHNCNSAQCICNYVHIIRNSNNPEKYHIILVDEFLGY